MSDILDSNGACNYLAVSRATLTRLLKRAEIPGQKVGRQWRFSQDQLKKWIERRSQATEKLTEARKKELFEQIFWPEYPDHPSQKSHPEEARAVFREVVTNQLRWEQVLAALRKYKQNDDVKIGRIREPANWLKSWREWWS